MRNGKTLAQRFKELGFQVSTPSDEAVHDVLDKYERAVEAINCYLGWYDRTTGDCAVAAVQAMREVVANTTTKKD